MRNYVLALLSMCYLVSLSQEPLKHEKKIYVSPDGRIYINKALPVYIWLSTDKEENSQKYKLESEVTTAYSNPMYFDTEGYNTVRSPSAVDPETRKTVFPKQDIIFEVYADSKSPVTKINYGESSTHTHEGKIYVNKKAEISLSARDITSGVENILFSIDGSPYKPYTDPIVLSEEKEYILKFYAADNVGNLEPVQELNIVFDKTSPTSKLEIEGDIYENIVSGKTKFVLTSEDQGIGLKNIYYRLDDGEKKAYTTPIKTAYISQGEHKISYYGVDKVDNTENETTYEFYVDKSSPTIIEEVMGKTFFANGREFSSGKSRLKLTAFDNKAGIKEIYYSVNGGEYQLYTKPVFLTQASGNLVIQSYAVDNVNNKSVSQSANEKASIPYIDLTGPKLVNLYSGPKFMTRDTVFINNKTQILLKAADAEAGINKIEYQLDGGEITEYTKPFSVESEGIHEVSYVGYDNVENTSNASFIFVVDNTGPEIMTQFSTTSTGSTKSENGMLKNYPSHVVLFLSSTDQVVGFDKMYYTMNNLPERLYQNFIQNIKTSGENTIMVRANDKLGNESKKEVRFVID